MSWLARIEKKGLTIDRPTSDGFIPASSALTGLFEGLHSPAYGLDANVVMAPVSWIMRNFTEADPVIERRVNDRWELAVDHEVSEFLQAPNPFYGWDALAKASILSYVLAGNAYWRKIRNRFGEVVALWYIPHFMASPVWAVNGTEFISGYQCMIVPGQPAEIIPVRDMVHFRFGMDPRQPRLGFAPLHALLREVMSDEEAANFTAAILSNMGVPGGVIAPKEGTALPSQDEVDEMKRYMKGGFTGNRRGEWLVLGQPTEIAQFGFNPNQLMLTNLRDISEERVCAMLGVPAAVVGFGAGLQATKVGATMKEMVRLAWSSCITPIQRSFAKEITRHLLPDFVSQTRRFRMRFDNSQASAFLEDESEKATRTALLVTAGVLRVDRAQEMLGLEVDQSQAIYLRPTSSAPVPAEQDPNAAPDDPAREPGSTAGEDLSDAQDPLNPPQNPETET